MSEMPDDKVTEESETETHKIVKTKIVNGVEKVHEEEEIRRKTKLEKDTEKNSEKEGGES